MTAFQGDPSARPWQRRETESIQAYEAFVIYKDMPYTNANMKTSRSRKRVADALGKSETLIKRWASTHDWVERTRAYDDSLAEKHEKVTERLYREDIIKVHEKHRAVANLMLAKVIEKLQSLGNKEIEAMSIGEMARLFEISVRIENESLGQPGEIVEQVHSKGIDRGRVLEAQSELEEWWKEYQAMENPTAETPVL